MKPRYIDANVILPMLTNKAHTLVDRHGVKLGETWLLSYDEIKEVIDKIPTAKLNIGDNEIISKTDRQNIELVANIFIDIAKHVNAIIEEGNDAGARVVK